MSSSAVWLSSEVRRAAMCNLDLHPTTLPYILSRSRDIDPINRKVIYAQSLAELPNMAVLSPEQRNIVIKNGLRDREESVKKTAAKLIGKWAGNVEGGLLEVCLIWLFRRQQTLSLSKPNTLFRLVHRAFRCHSRDQGS